MISIFALSKEFIEQKIQSIYSPNFFSLIFFNRSAKSIKLFQYLLFPKNLLNRKSTQCTAQIFVCNLYFNCSEKSVKWFKDMQIFVSGFFYLKHCLYILWTTTLSVWEIIVKKRHTFLSCTFQSSIFYIYPLFLGWKITKWKINSKSTHSHNQDLAACECRRRGYSISGAH